MEKIKKDVDKYGIVRYNKFIKRKEPTEQKKFYF